MAGAAHSGQPHTANTPEMVAGVEHVLWENHHITLDEVVSELNINHGSAAYHSQHAGVLLSVCMVDVDTTLTRTEITPLLNVLSQSYTCCSDKHASP